jgi:hypothetical protein
MHLCYKGIAMLIFQINTGKDGRFCYLVFIAVIMLYEQVAKKAQ